MISTKRALGFSALLLSAATLSACGGSAEEEASSAPAAAPAEPAAEAPAQPSTTAAAPAEATAEAPAPAPEPEPEPEPAAEEAADMETADLDSGDAEPMMQQASMDGDLPADHPALGGDPALGKRVFTACMSCHSVKEGQNKVGPSLYGIVGRPAGQVANFNYSDANAGSGLVWTKDVLFEYLENPRGYMPGTRMIFPGLPKEEDRRNVIAYLEEAAKE